MPLLIIVRHGQSKWNLENRFTGEVDIELTEAGIEEARSAGKLLKNFKLDKAYTSVLARAIHTLTIILMESGLTAIPVVKSKALNERNYGDLQGLNKSEVETQYGEEQFFLWRRSFEVAPPHGESLKDTYNRVIPYYQDHIVPDLMEGKNILIVAHGNSLRSLMMFLEKISPEVIPSVTLPTGAPRVYEFDKSLSLVNRFDIK